MNFVHRFNKLIIIGAPRSGTNMLRNVLASLPGICTWPCDEINYIWRHGNAAYSHDELLPKHATPRVQAYVRRSFESLALRQRASCVVEKTCANSLRVAFVERIVPDAKYIFLFRDGRDAAASAMRRWTAPLDWRYVVKKAQFVPIADLPRYALFYAGNRLRRLASRDRRLACWGPRFAGIQHALAELSLAEVCAMQWERCVARAQTELSQIDTSRVVRIQYERFVAQPAQELRTLLDQLQIDATTPTLTSAVRHVSDRRVGQWRSGLDEAVLEQMAPILSPQLGQLGYPLSRRENCTASAA